MEEDGERWQQHPYYELLPSYIAQADVQKERDELVRKAQETLVVFDELRSGTQERTHELQKRHFRAIETVYKLKHELPKTLHMQLIYALVDLLWERDGSDFDDVHMELRAVGTLSRLLGKWTKRHVDERSELALSWRSAWRAIERTCFKSKRCIRQASQPSLQQLGTETVKTVEQSRKFFHPSDASIPLATELWTEFSPIIKATQANTCFKALALFSMFVSIPSDNEALAQQLLPDWFATWSSVSKCSEWDGHWMKIISRVAKKYPETSSLDAYLPFVFAKVHDSLELPSDLGAPFKSNMWPSVYNVINGGKRVDNYAMRLSVHLLRNPQGPDNTPAPANQYVLDILNLMKAFFHPSNVANSANALGVSVYFFSNMLARRLGHEKAQASGNRDAKLALEVCHPLLDSLLELSFFGIYSKNRSVASKCMYLIKNLICIDPAHCAAPVLQEMMKGLDPMAMSHAHLASTAISTMGVILYHLMCGKDPKGSGLFFSTYLSPILTLTLPGIDANDEKKTVSTISLYFHLFSWLPLVNDPGKSSNFAATKTRGTLSKRLFDEMSADLFAEIKELSGDADQKLWELGAFLEEWSLSLVDRCFEFIKSRVSQAEGSSHSQDSRSTGGRGNHGGASKRDGNEDGLVLEILNLMGMLYAQMSPEIYAQAVRKTLRFVSNVFFTTPFGGKVVSNLIHSCIQADPSQSFASFMALVLEKLRVTKESINVAGLMANEKMWYLHLFDGVARSNGAEDRIVLQYQDEVRVILAHFLNNEEEKDIYEAAGTVLNHLLGSLLGVYPTEFRSLPPQEWTNAVSKDSGMFQYLGTAVTWKRLSIVWHEPNEHELVFAYQLLERHVLDTFNALATVQNEKDRTVRSWVPRLKQIHSALRGARGILVNGSASSDSLLASGSLPLLKKGLGTNTELLQKFADLKTNLMQKVHEIVLFWQQNGSGSTMEIQIWQSVVSIIHQLLVGRGEYLERHRHKEKQNVYIKATTLDVASEAVRKARKELEWGNKNERAPLSSRNEMIERVLFFYSKRKVQEHFELARSALSNSSAHRELYEALLLDVEMLTKNPYEGIRTNASSVMKEMSELYAKWVHSRISTLINVLEGKTADGEDDTSELKEETIAGVVQTLSRSIVIKYMWRKRDQFFGRIVKAVLKSNDVILKCVQGEASKLKVGVQVEAFFMAVLGSWRYVRNNNGRSTTLLATLLEAEPASTEHWKFQLVHLVSLYPLLQPQEMPLPLDVWKLVVKQLKNEVLPVRQVALLLLAQLVKLHKCSATTSDDAVDAFLYSKETIQVLVDAFVTNHKNMNRFAASADGQHANSAPTNWSFGVDDVLRSISGNSASFPKAPPLSSVRLLNQSADVFRSLSINSTKLIQKLVQINPNALVQSGVLTYLHELASEKTDSKVNQEDRQAALTTLSEWVAGLLRGFLKSTTLAEDDAATQIAAVVDILKMVLPHVSVSLVEPWAQVLYLAARPSSDSKFPLNRLDKLLAYLLQELEQSFVRATAEDYARQVKWLVLVESLAIHVLAASASSESSPAYPLAKELSERALHVINEYALMHQYKIIRDRVGKMLFLLGVYAFAPATSPLSGVPVDASMLPLTKLVDAAALNEDEAAAQGDNNGDDAETGTDTSLYARETAMQWLACTEKYGDTRDLLAVMNALFPVAFLSQNHPKTEVALFARNTTNAIASSVRLYFAPSDTTISVSDLDAVFTLLETFAVHRFWKTRGAVLRFLTTFSFYHWIFFSTETRDRVQMLVTSFLTDEQREVQEMAKYTLRSLIHNQREDVVEALSARWTEQAQEARIVNPKTKRRISRLETEGPDSEDELARARQKLRTNEAVMVRSVLGMCAIVLAFPHTLPPFVPRMFEELGKFLYLKNRSVTVSYLEKAVKETLLEFKRTHQDNWLETKSKFSPAQLNVIEDVSISPGYYT
ncbi:Proteasome activator complex subunit 4, partial [Globisporangium splendens]